MSKYPALTAELLRRGYSDDDIKKVLGQNMLRVMREAERVAAVLQKERPPVDGDYRGAGRQKVRRGRRLGGG